MFYIFEPHFIGEDIEALRGYVTCWDLTGIKGPIQGLKVDNYQVVLAPLAFGFP